MRYHVLATDYDGTLAHHGRVDDGTLLKLEHVRKSGRKLVMVTGRELNDLKQAFPPIELFDLIVAENGALLYEPATREEIPLAEPPPVAFAEALRQRGVPVATGRVIVATWEPHETTVLEVIREQALELQVIFNKGAVMVLPSGVNKATGLQAGLARLGMSPRNCVGVGDAENDLAFLTICECAVAVANALPTTRDKADWVTDADHSDGVGQLIDALLANDLLAIGTRIRRHDVLVGSTEAGEDVMLPPYGKNVLLAGSSGAGKSTAATALLERLAEQGYQYCIIDPEGDYANMDGVVALGDEQGAPGVDEILTALQQPDVNVAANLVNIGLHDRPAYLERLLPRLLEMYTATGRPHWIVLDEAHHLLPAEHAPRTPALLDELPPTLWITVYPDHISHVSLEQVDWMLVIGADPDATLKKFASALRQPAPTTGIAALETGEALLWDHRRGREVRRLRIGPPRTQRLRHKRKYAQGDLGPELSFYFQGPEQKLNLRANNLSAFLQLAEGVDDATWDFHLRRGDYSEWFQTCIKDPQLAEAARRVESEPVDAPDSRARIRAEVEARYTGPA